MKTLSQYILCLGPIAFVVGFFVVVITACKEPNQASIAPKANYHLEIDTGSPITAKVPVYIVEIEGQKYYATESYPRFFNLCPIVK